MGKTRISSVVAVGIVGGLTLTTLSAHADTFSYVNISNFANNNIFTDLNQNFPNTGPGVPGSHTGTPNASYIYDPFTYIPPAATTTGSPFYTITPTVFARPLPNNGVTFQLNSNAAGHDFVQFGAFDPANPYTGPNSFTVAIGDDHVTTVYALMAAYNGQSFNVTFTGLGGETQIFNGVSVPDFNGGSINTCASVPGVCQKTAYQVQDIGAGGSGNSTTGAFNIYDLTEVSFTLDGALAADTLASATFTSNGYESLLFGLTVDETGSTSPVPEPASLALFGSALFGFGLLRQKKRS
jgi:hypothetical protein